MYVAICEISSLRDLMLVVMTGSWSGFSAFLLDGDSPESVNPKRNQEIEHWYR